MEVFYEKGKKYNAKVHGKPYYRTSITINGQRYQVYGDGEKDAQKKIEALKESAAKGFDPSLRRATAGEIFDYWLYNVKRADSEIKASSFSRYECAYRTHIKPNRITSVPLSKISSARMQLYVSELYEDKGVTPTSIKATLKVWKMFTKWAVDEGYMAKDPCRNIRVPGKYTGGKKEIDTFEEDEREKIIRCMEETNYQYSTLIKLAFATGMRQGELLGLKWSDIDFDENIIHVQRSTAIVNHIDKNGKIERYREVWTPKTVNSIRDIPILPTTRTLLRRHKIDQRLFFMAQGKKGSEYVFCTENGRIIDSSSLTKSYKRLLKRADVPYRKFHTIRHTFATEAIRRGVDPKDLQMLMGHADIQTTYIYVQANEKSKRDAIERMGKII